jgi:hypothetical protein
VADSDRETRCHDEKDEEDPFRGTKFTVHGLREGRE